MKEPQVFVVGAVEFPPRSVTPEAAGKASYVQFAVRLEERAYNDRTFAGSLVWVRSYAKDAADLEKQIHKGDVVSVTGSIRAEVKPSKDNTKHYANLIVVAFPNNISIEAHAAPTKAAPELPQEEKPAAVKVPEGEDDVPF